MLIENNNPQHTCNEEVTNAPITGAIAKKLFEQIIQGSFPEPLSDDISKLFPLDKITEFDINETTFTVTFSEMTSFKLVKANGTFLEGATCNIPKIVKGVFDLDHSKMSFPDPKQSLWVQKYFFYSTLSSVEYDKKSDAFTLGGIKTVTVSRTLFQEIIRDHKTS